MSSVIRCRLWVGVMRWAMSEMGDRGEDVSRVGRGGGI